MTLLVLLLLPLMSSAESPLVPPSEGDIQVTEAKWGVDGFSRYKTFVPLRVTIKNRSPVGQTLRLRLTREQALLEEGEVLEQEIHLTGESTRILHFVPFVSDPGETWTLRWGDREGESHTVKSQSADDGVVLIIPTESLSQRTGMLHTMKEDEFPTSITALDTLRIVVLDQEPRWTGARRKAFEEWLVKGGSVFILNQPDGSVPKFSPEFSYLDPQGHVTRHGRGTIQRLNIRSMDVTRAVIEREILHRKLTGGDLDQKLAAYVHQSVNQYSRVATSSQSPPLGSYQRDQVLTVIKDAAANRRYWLPIYLTVLIYIGWQWRVGWRWGLTERQPERFYAWISALSFGFAVAFLLFGQLGSSGGPRVCSVMVAHQVTPGVYDVEGWSVLATSMNAGDLALSVPGSGQYYGATESFGQNPLLVRDGRVQFDLPSYSTFKLAFRTRQEMPDIPVTLLARNEESLQIRSEILDISSANQKRIYAAAIVIDDRLYELSGKTGKLKPTERWGITMADWLSPYTPHAMKRARKQFSVLGWLFYQEGRSELLDSAFTDVLGNGFSVGPTVFADSFHAPNGFARVMLYVDLPPELKFDGDFTEQHGRMLYVVDLPIEGTP